MGCPHDEIDIVILSHLHFDHAGGVLAPYKEGVEPSLLFPKAKFYVGKENYQRNLEPSVRDKASFISYLPELLKESGRLHLLNEGDPSPWGEEFSFYFIHGHTPGLMLVEVMTDQGIMALVTDLIPGVHWIHLPIIMGYDRYPEQSVDEKKVFLDRALEQNFTLFLTHDPDNPFAQIQKDNLRYIASV